MLTLRIQPNEGVQLRFASKVPGYDVAVGSVAMDMTYVEAFGGEPPEAYERLLLDAMRGDATLFSRRDAVEASWAWVDPILEHFERNPPRDLPNYEPGSWGPEHAARVDAARPALLARVLVTATARTRRAWIVIATFDDAEAVAHAAVERVLAAARRGDEAHAIRHRPSLAIDAGAPVRPARASATGADRSALQRHRDPLRRRARGAAGPSRQQLRPGAGAAARSARDRAVARASHARRKPMI